MQLGDYLRLEISKVTSAVRTKHEIWAASERVARELNLAPNRYRHDTPVSLLLYPRIYADYLTVDLDDFKSRSLQSANDIWYSAITNFTATPTNVDLSCISLPMVYRICPERPVSCALVLCDASDNIKRVFDGVIRLVRLGIGIGIEMLSSDPTLVDELAILDTRLIKEEGLRENFVAVNVLACHPDIRELLSRCNKSGGRFFQKINIGVWWSPSFCKETTCAIIQDRSVDLSIVKKNPSSCWDFASSRYKFSSLIEMKLRGGVPYLLHIEACPDYGQTIYGTNLCTEVFLPLRRDAAGTRHSQLCVLGNVDVSRSQKLTRNERRRIHELLVDVVSGVWDQIERSEIDQLFDGLAPVDVASRPCGIGMTGFFSAACDAEVPYNLEFVQSKLAEFIDDCRAHVATKPKIPSVLFSIPPSSNSEFNMMCSPNVMHWADDQIVIITNSGNFRLRNDKHRPELLSYTDKVVISSMLDQSLSLDHIITNPPHTSLDEMMRYMFLGYARVGDCQVKTKTISYYTKANVERQDKQCVETCDL